MAGRLLPLLLLPAAGVLPPARRGAGEARFELREAPDTASTPSNAGCCCCGCRCCGCAGCFAAVGDVPLRLLGAGVDVVGTSFPFPSSAAPVLIAPTTSASDLGAVERGGGANPAAAASFSASALKSWRLSEKMVRSCASTAMVPTLRSTSSQGSWWCRRKMTVVRAPLSSATNSRRPDQAHSRDLRMKKTC